MIDSDLSKKTLRELKNIIADAQALADAKQHESMMAIFFDLRDAAEKLGVSIEQIIQTGNEHGLSRFCKQPKKYKKAIIKYRDPQDHSLTWCGRGLPPKWMQASLDKGWTKNDFLIVEKLSIVQYPKPLVAQYLKPLR